APPGCLVLAVSVLTSLNGEDMATIWGRNAPVDGDQEVLRLARLATDAGIRGLVCSGREAATVRQALGGGGVAIRIVVPGIRFAAGVTHDQARVVTPGEAVRAGADYVVVGRAVTAADDPVAAMRRLDAELAMGLNE
ncbi:MAG: orotidine 5'-phosphate decarboxylase / HUMPS family protein, partial [Gemmatimonadaceae bacterium]